MIGWLLYIEVPGSLRMAALETSGLTLLSARLSYITTRRYPPRTKAITLWQNPLMNGCTDSRFEGFIKRANERSPLSIGANGMWFPGQ